MAAVDLEVLYLPHYRSVQHQLARVALLLVNGAARAVPDHGLDALSTERMAALDGDDRLREHSLAHRTEQRLRLFYKLGWFARHGFSSVLIVSLKYARCRDRSSDQGLTTPSFLGCGYGGHSLENCHYCSGGVAVDQWLSRAGRGLCVG